jgi:hypothetical protein
MSRNSAPPENPREQIIRSTLREQGITVPDEAIKRVAEMDSSAISSELQSLRPTGVDTKVFQEQLDLINRKLDQTVKKESFMKKVLRTTGSVIKNVALFPINHPVLTILGVLGLANFGLPMLFEYLAGKEWGFAKTTLDWFNRMNKSFRSLGGGFGMSADAIRKGMAGPLDPGMI